MANRGLMADHNFIGKSQLLGWLNSTLRLKLERVEDTCTGAVACQIMDCLHPGSVNIKRVDFNVRNDYEFVTNYKELQQAFNKVGVDRAFNVNQLSKGKLQDNNEFMQWFKGYWDSITGGQDVAESYDAVGRRQLCKTGDWKKMSLGEGAVRPPSAPTEAMIPAVRRAPLTSAPNAISQKTAAKSAKAPLREEPQKAAQAISAELNAHIAELMEQITELKLKVDLAERERDFYFDKLRDIEILCQAPELADVPVLRTVEKVLYAADSQEAKAAMLEAQEQYGARFIDSEVPCVEEANAATVEAQ